MFATGRKDFFFEKKKQKTFVRCRGPVTSARLKKKKFFGSFFQKRTFLPCFFRLLFSSKAKR
jgi:hypothetical protein